MLRYVIAAVYVLITAAAVVRAQSPIPGFPPGLFGNRAAISGGGVSYTGPGDVVSSALAWWGFRAYNSAKRGNSAVNVCNVADVACGDLLTDVTTGALIITTIGGSSCSVVTCTIKTLYDQTQGTNCGGSACDLTQAVIALRPVFKVSCVNSLPCADFTSGGVLRLTNTTGFGAVAQPLTMSMVYNRTVNNSAFERILTTAAGGSGLTGNNVANSIVMFVGTSIPAATITDNAFHAGQFIFNNTTGFAYIDGTNTTMDLGASTALTAGRIDLGNNSVTANPLMLVPEIGVWASGFSASPNASGMNSNQHTYWGF